MSEEIIKVLDDLAERFGVAIDWTSKNVTPYLQELFDKFIAWELWTSVVWGGFALLFIIPGIVIITKSIKELKKENCDVDIAVPGFIVAMGLLILGMIILMCQIFDIVTCVTFPEKALFDYVNHYLEWHS